MGYWDRTDYAATADSGCNTSRCVVSINELDALHRQELLNRLSYERLQRKYNDIIAIYRSSDQDWGQTMHTLLFGVVGGRSNKMAFQRLATRVRYAMLMRENSALTSLEAMLLGGSGLIELYPDDEYISFLKEEWRHLRAKYDISPMDISEWQLHHIYPNNHPTLRLMQLAASLHNGAISMQSVTGCCCRKDVYELFSGRASAYWVKQFMYDPTKNITRRIGQFKSDMLGINFVAQMTFAYGSYTQSDTLINRAIGLLEDIPSEQNIYTERWNSRGKISNNSFESQALLQLEFEYCSAHRHKQCPLAECLRIYGYKGE